MFVVTDESLKLFRTPNFFFFNFYVVGGEFLVRENENLFVVPLLHAFTPLAPVKSSK